MSKLDNADNRLPDRFIYNEAISIRNTLIKQEADKLRLFSVSDLFGTLNKVELIEVDTIEACGIDSDCTIRRTKYKLPKIIASAGGSLIRKVTSLDGTSVAIITTDISYIRKIHINDKHAKRDPLFYLYNEYGYFPNVDWPYAVVEAVFEDSEEIDSLNACDDEKVVCTPFYDKTFPIPEYLESGLKDLLNARLFNYYHRIIEDTDINKNPAK